MAIHANSTLALGRTLLREAAAPGRLLPTVDLSPAHRAELLAILDAGPLPHAFMTRAQRRAMQAGVDALIDYLDAVEPDPDLEPTMGFVMPSDVDECEPDADLEPSLGTPEVEFSEVTGHIVSRGHIDQRHWRDGLHCVNGWDVDREHDTADDEPTLGAPEHLMSCSYGHGIDGVCDQTWWARGGDVGEREAVCEDEGACIQSQKHDADEPEQCLGAPEGHLDQRLWADGRLDAYQEGDHGTSYHRDSRRFVEVDALRETSRREARTLLARVQPQPVVQRWLVEVAHA